MHDIRKILVATDLTENSSAAIQLAMKIAEETGATVTLFHAFHVPSPGSNVMIDISDVIHNRVSSQMEGLQHILSRNHPKVKLKTKVITGQAAVMIRKEIQVTSTDLLVIGTVAQDKGLPVHGTAALVLDTGVSTLIVPSNINFLPESMSRVSIAIDTLDKFIEQQVEEALQWCETLRIKEVHFLHVRSPEEEKQPDLERFIALLKTSSKLNMRMVLMPKGDPESSIRKYLAKEEIHLLFVFHQSKNKINPLADLSMTRALVEGGENPVFIIP